MPPWLQELTALSKYLKNGIMPVWYASPPRIGEPNARILPALIPIPARCDTYLTIDDAVALMLSKLSSLSINTHELN